MRNQTNSLRVLNLVVILSSSLLILACSNGLAHKDSAPEKPAGPAAAVQTTTHQGTGIVRGMNPKFPSIEIEHEEIKGLMPAMKMEFYVKDKSLLDGLVVGDQIDFTIENRVGGLQIIAIRKR
jgi:Cu(I)/Ag(I) efflux system protein CusF